MKTSNKLLIAFASALILIPILGMIYVSQVNYKPGKYTDIVEPKLENFSTETKHMSSIAIGTSFQSINFGDAKQQLLNITFIKDEKFGIKIPTEYKDQISTTVDAAGQLQVVVKNMANDNDRRHYIDIYVYAPTLKEVNVTHADAAYIVASVDSLKFNVKNTGSASVGRGTHIKFLSFTANGVPEINFNQDDVKSMSLNLANSSFRSQSNSYDNLSIATTGDCKISIMGNYDQENKYLINNLVLNTVGKADVKLENIKTHSCAGSFSDQTTVQMPAVNINQMYKK